MSAGEIILYATEDGQATIQLRAVDGMVWLTQAQMADLFDTSPQAITQLLAAIYRGGELQKTRTCKLFLQVRDDGGRTLAKAPDRPSPP
jgi:hypothetical protein